MALSQDQVRDCLRLVGAFIEKIRPPQKVRDQLDYRADIKGSEITIVSSHLAYDDKQRWMDHPVARMRWIGTQKVWRLYWMRADLKWHAYEPRRESPNLAILLAEVARDPHCCFFG